MIKAISPIKQRLLLGRCGKKEGQGLLWTHDAIIAQAKI